MQRALKWKHLIEEYGRLGVADERTVRGRFEWDEEMNGELPLLVIDGKAVTWDDFGRMLSSYEGWQFKLQILDPSDEPA